MLVDSFFLCRDKHFWTVISLIKDLSPATLCMCPCSDKQLTKAGLAYIKSFVSKARFSHAFGFTQTWKSWVQLYWKDVITKIRKYYALEHLRCIKYSESRCNLIAKIWIKKGHLFDSRRKCWWQLWFLCFYKNCGLVQVKNNFILKESASWHFLFVQLKKQTRIQG